MPGVKWVVTHQPAANTIAIASKAAGGANKRGNRAIVWRLGPKALAQTRKS